MDTKILVLCLLALFAASASGELSARFYAKRASNEVDLDSKQMIKLGKESMKEVAKAANQVIDFKQGAVKLLKKLATIMTAFGPAMAAAGFVISLITMFLPEEDSAELKFMKEKFNEVNNKLDVIVNRLDSIDTNIEYQGSKVSFGPYIRKINSLKRNLQYVIDAPDDVKRKQNQEYFVQTFTSMYHDSAMTLYTGMIGEESEYFGYDLLDITTKKYKCNVNKVFEFCAVNGKALADAMTIEGAYFGFKNMTYRIESEGDKWKVRMKKLSDRCQNFVSTCTKNWKTYSDEIVENVYKKKHSASNADMASQMYKELTETIPHRAWGVWVYKDAWGFGPHTVQHSKGNTYMKWHKDDKCVTVTSVDLSYSRFNAKEANKVLDKATADISNCGKRPYGDPAKRLVAGMVEHYGRWPGGAMYAIQKGIGLEFRLPDGHYVTRDFDKTQNCKGWKTYYKHHLFLFH